MSFLLSTWSGGFRARSTCGKKSLLSGSKVLRSESSERCCVGLGPALRRKAEHIRAPDRLRNFLARLRKILDRLRNFSTAWEIS